MLTIARLLVVVQIKDTRQACGNYPAIAEK